MKNVPEGRRNAHETLIGQIRSKRGKEYGERLNMFWSWRKQADYDRPEFLEVSPFQIDWPRLRVSAREKRRQIEREFALYTSELGSLLQSHQR